jgi:hypothetical protein
MTINCKKTIIYLLFFSTSLFCPGCKNDYEIARDTNNAEEGILALEKISDQYLLANLAYYALNVRVKEAAVNKIVDEHTLYSILSESINADTISTELETNVRVAAAIKLKDQTCLINAVYKLCGSTYSGIKPVFDTITANVIIPKVRDQLLLAFVGLKLNETFVDYKVNDPILKDFIINKILDTDFLSLKKATRNIPESQRWHIMANIIPVIQILRIPKIREKFGDITSIDVNWSLLTAAYNGANVEGGKVNCIIHLQKFNKTFSYTWKTNFPSVITFPSDFDYVLAVPVNPENIIEPILNLLTNEELNSITSQCWPIGFLNSNVNDNPCLTEYNPYIGIQVLAKSKLNQSK